MEHNNNNKDMKQGNHLQPLPPELEWSKMKDGILDKMHSIEQAELTQANGKDSRKRTWLFLNLCMTLAFSITIGLIFFYQEETTEQPAQTNDVVQIPDSEANENDSTFSHTPEPTNDQSLPEEFMAGTTESANPNDLLPVPEKSALDQGPQESNRARREKALLSEILSLNANQSPSSFSETAQDGLSQHTSATVDDSVRSHANVPYITTRIQVPLIRQLLPALANQQVANLMNQAPAASDETESTSLPLIPRTQPVNLLVLEGGVNLWTEGYGNSLSDREQYETPIPSFQLQGSYLKGLKGGYFIMAGVQYQQLESRLDYSSTIDDYQITLKDTIVEVRKNLLTGEETLIRGDVVQTVQAERIVRHYNKTQLFKTSLAIGKNWRFNAFQTDVYLGGALNGIVRNQGRMLFDNEIIDYKGNSTPAFQNQWTVDGLAGVRLHYFPYERMGITTSIQAQRSLMNWSTQEGVRLYPFSFGLQLGLSYKL
jgi:hypothetical protein